MKLDDIERVALDVMATRGPSMPDDMRQVTLLWSHKMLDRFRGKADLEAQYRRMQLLTQSLEDYFALRGAWFRGPREAFPWLRQHDPATFQCFEKASQPGASDAAFAELVHGLRRAVVLAALHAAQAEQPMV